MATNAIDYMEERARPAAKAIAALPREDPSANSRFNKNVGRVIGKILSDLGIAQQTKGS